MISIKKISKNLKSPYSLLYFRKIDSTNSYAKREILPEGTVVIAKKQTGGRGRSGKKFFSKGGVYLTAVIKPQDCDLGKITQIAAVSVANAIETTTHIPCGIKWVNDIFVNGKKVCGILCEANFDTEAKLTNVIIGIGVNVKKVKFPKDVSLIATSLNNECNKKTDENLLISAIISYLTKYLNNNNYLEEYKNRQILLGKEITVIPKGKPVFSAKAVDIADDGGLIIDVNGETKTMRYGEVSIKTK